MDQNLKSIRAQLEKFGHRDQGFRYPESFQKQVAQYARGQIGRYSKNQISKTVGIPWVTIGRWMEQIEGQTNTGLVPVRITASELQTKPSVSMVTPEGWRIEGLSVDQTCRILERMR